MNTSLIGNIFQIAAMCFSVVAIAMVRKTYSRYFVYYSCCCTMAAFGTLIYGFVISDFSVRNVFMNSSTIKPLAFKIAASWASHEGSILLWLTLLSCISSLYLYLSGQRDTDTQNIVIINPYQIIILSIIALLFSSFIYFTSNPLVGLSFTPEEGLGLNPVLQDVALIIHPPILYCGYLCYIVPFTVSCLILLDKSLSFNIKQFQLARIFANYGILAMTCGIALGSWWAYRELGWGGYWFFDPVENISLMPWLSSIALHHTMSITMRTGRLLYWSIILSIITFLLAIFGTFLVRSGIIVSIHSFAPSPERGVYMLLIFAFIASASLGLLIFAKQKHTIVRRLSFIELGVVIGNITWLIALVTLMSAVIYPIVLLVLKKESASVDPQYFINIFIPICLFAAFLAAIYSVRKDYVQRIVIFLLASLSTWAINIKLDCEMIGTIANFTASLLIIHMLNLLILTTNYCRQMPHAKTIAMILAHTGFGLLILSCTINGRLQREIDFIGEIGDTIHSEKFDIYLNDIKFAQGKNYYRQIVEFSIDDKESNSITTLKPENRLYIIEKTIAQESDIYSYLTHDLYAVLNKIESDTIHAKIYYRPFISFIWLSVIIIISGLLISMLHKKSNPEFVTPDCFAYEV